MFTRWLGLIYNLFPLFGANGGIIVRQKGGVVGNEVQVYHDGTNGNLISQTGNLLISSVGKVITTPATWIQDTAGEAALAANFTDNTGTLAVTTLSFNVIAGRSYRIDGIFKVSNSTATEGFQCNFNGGTATATTFFAAATTVGSVSVGAASTTTLAGLINYTVTTGTDYIFIHGYLKVNAGGTLILNAAENTTGLGTMTLGAGSWLALYDTVNL